MLAQLDFAALLPYWAMLARGLIFTILLTLVTAVVGVAVGALGATARVYGPRWLDRAVGVYVELIRNTPFLVQLFFIYFGLPALGLKLTEATAAGLAMIVNLGAYSTEILRAGFQAIGKGQIEAGRSLALKPAQIWWLILLKPAFRNIWPALTSQIVIVMLGSAVVSQISAEDLTYAANLIQSINFRAFEVYVVATLLYLALSAAARAFMRWLGGRLFPRT